MLFYKSKSQGDVFLLGPTIKIKEAPWKATAVPPVLLPLRLHDHPNGATARPARKMLALGSGSHSFGKQLLKAVS